MNPVDVAIVGGGVAGLAAAWRLASEGRDVALFERFALGHDRGSSHGATRIFRFAYSDPVYVRLAQAALPLWRELEVVSGREILRITGGVDAGDPSYLDACTSALESCGARVERLVPPARRERFPWLEAGDDPAIFSPDTGVLAAAHALETLATAARQAGASIRDQTACESIEPHGDGVSIRSSAGDLKAGRCIVAAGAWARSLLEPLGIDLPVRVTREQVFYFRGSDDILPFIHRGSLDRYGVPAFAGAPGVKIAEHATGERTSADGRSFEMDPEGAARIAAYVAEALPGFDPEPVAFETCLYTTTVDEGFVIDAAGPIVIASACSGHGFKFGPVVGAMASALATGKEPPVSPTPFELARLHQ